MCKVREEPAPRLAAERDALGSHCLECLAASASRDFWGFPEAQCHHGIRPERLEHGYEAAAGVAHRVGLEW